MHAIELEKQNITENQNGKWLLCIVLILGCLPWEAQALECLDGLGRAASLMKTEYDLGDFELPCDTMVVEENTASRVSAMAWLYFSPRLHSTERIIIVKGSVVVEGVLGAQEHVQGDGIGDPAYYWRGVKIEPCAEAVFNGATILNTETPLEILSRYTHLEGVRFIQSASLLLPDSSTFSLAPAKLNRDQLNQAIVRRFASEDLAYFQSGRGRCKDREKRISARAQASNGKREYDRFDPSIISFLVYSGITLFVIGLSSSFSYLR